jgi:flagellar basal-body rod modification protein FlgD
MTPVNDTTAAKATTTKTPTAAAPLSKDYQLFLSLLTSQLQNQDPLDPLKTNEWVTQLVQYNSVEQQIKTNKYLENIANNTKGQSNFSTGVSYIGKMAVADGNIASLKYNEASWSYKLGAQAESVTLSVKDSSGTIVYSTTGNTSAGQHPFTWDGTQATGGKLTSGDYSLEVTATNFSGQSIVTNVSIAGKVTSVSQEGGNTLLRLGNSLVDVSKITSVSEPL